MKTKTALITFLFILTAVTGSFGETTFTSPLQDVGGPILHSINIPADPEIARFIEEYLSDNGRKTFYAILDRGAPYLEFIYDRLVEHDMPPELMYLPAIESGFKTWAVSRSGAAGLWQFMMNSISPYNIEVNEWQDDRRDFWKATEAALSKLEYNFQRLGSWPLAVAAYNCGLGRVERAVAASGTGNYIELYEQGYLPRETRLYVPKFFAFAHLATYPERYDIESAAGQAGGVSGKWTRIKLEQAVNLQILSDKSGLPYKILRESNAELRHGITPPVDSGYFLKVPAEYSDNVERILAMNEEPLIRFYIHEIRSGDTYYALSRHFGVPVSMIEDYNPSAEARALRAGQKIIIPALKEANPFHAEDRTEIRWQDTSTYMVKTGDSLWSISRKFRTSAEEIAYNNGISIDEILRAGIIIQVPGAD
ncbi:MAG: transglycosylase SLT domain-containing protein [Spirochaetales bacterium]|nr:transglycosylase SLT domain-containing protein [Spirochaetales bacterium]